MLDLREIATAIGEPAILPTVGHELRTPLTSICGYLETVLEEELDARTSRRFLQTAQREAQRLAALIDAFLRTESSRPMAPFTVATPSHRCDVAEQIRRVVETLVPLAQRRDVTIRTSVPSSAIARVDTDECIHALTNLIENAIKHGHTRGTIAVCCTAGADDAVCITVDDDGTPGAAAWSALFDTGARGETQAEGRGIGLAIVRAIARRAGGDVSATTSSMGGARFTLRLPAG